MINNTIIEANKKAEKLQFSPCTSGFVHDRNGSACRLRRYSIDGEHGGFPEEASTIYAVQQTATVCRIARVPDNAAYQINLYSTAEFRELPALTLTRVKRPRPGRCMSLPSGRQTIWGGGRGTEFNDQTF
ncbi:MAG: hypothetical protein CM1200mP39_01600 [Dehalococcoidia bacterium]|nr:MAG: hypothetical protein CM1200mP39_01600 [Dehalococcoidia bacterium]